MDIEQRFAELDESERCAALSNLRDEFAKAALTGLLSDVSRVDHRAHENAICKEIAKLAYAIADAMMKAREG
jgi:hypothetical protein